MYSIISQINPAYRTAFIAWLFSRLCLWGVVVAKQSPEFISSPRIAYGGSGAPMLQLLQGALSYIGEPAAVMAGGFGLLFAHLWSTWGMISLLGELSLLAGAVGMYHFSRRDSLPQVAERATWLWMICPLMLWTVLDISWAFIAGFGALSLALAEQGRHHLALLSYSLALGFKPEFLCLWPAVAYLGWKSYVSGRHPEYSRLLLVFGPPAFFTGWIVFAFAMAGRAGISLRGLRAESIWRVTWNWQGWVAYHTDIYAVILCSFVLLLAIRNVRRTPRAWILITAPCAFLPLLHEPAGLGIAWLLLALPAFAQLGRATENPTLERPLHTLFFGSLLCAAVFLL